MPSEEIIRVPGTLLVGLSGTTIIKFDSFNHFLMNLRISVFHFQKKYH